MRKMAAFVFSLLIMLACEVQARGETTADDAREAARRTATVWYLAATYGKSSSQELFSGWQPENFNWRIYAAEINPQFYWGKKKL